MIWTLLLGLVIGAIAKLIMPGKDVGGVFVTMILGVIGSMLANFVGVKFGWYEEGEASGFIASIIGAIILLAIYRSVIGHRKHLPHH